MSRFPALSATLVFSTLTAFACAGADIGMGSGMITVHNSDASEIEVLISDNDECVIGLNSSINAETTRTYDIMTDEEGQSYFCVNGDTPFEVEDGMHYMIKGGALVEDKLYTDY